jgi:phosphoglycolate phosphatase
MPAGRETRAAPTRAVFFDLDGTLADTAPDLTLALNLMRRARGLPDIPLSATRPVTSTGARGMIGVGFALGPDAPDFAALRDEFLANYERNLCRETRLFPGMAELIAALEARSIAWGVVTNKAERFTFPLLERLGLRHRAAAIIGGDTTGKSKPHPEPLLAASRAAGIAPQECVYVGDDERDIVAGRAAEMRTVAVAYGYLNGSDPRQWGADAVIGDPRELLALLA